MSRYARKHFRVKQKEVAPVGVYRVKEEQAVQIGVVVVLALLVVFIKGLIIGRLTKR